MALTTQTICDACGLGKKVDKKGATGPEVQQLNMEVTGSISVKLDVHPTKKCILAAVKTALDKHFLEAPNGAGSNGA